MMKRFIVFTILCSMSIFTLAQPKINIFVFTKTTDYYHEATPNAIKALYEIAHEQKWGITITEDSSMFTKEILQKYNVVVFLMTGGNDLLDKNQKEAFKKFIQLGGGFVGIHSATVTEYNWPWYGQLVGAYFKGHPPVHTGKLVIEERNHPSTLHFQSDTFTWTDEWYSFSTNPRKMVNVLMSVDEKSYNIKENPWFKGVDLVMGDHPLVWCHLFDGGRSFQTALGHQPEAYDELVFRKHLIGAIEWAAGKK